MHIKGWLLRARLFDVKGWGKPGVLDMKMSNGLRRKVANFLFGVTDKAWSRAGWAILL